MPGASIYKINSRCKYCFFTAKHNQQMLDTHIQSMHKGGKVSDLDVIMIIVAIDLSF